MKQIIIGLFIMLLVACSENDASGLYNYGKAKYTEAVNKGIEYRDKTKYKDGTECNCDSIGRNYYSDGHIVEEMPFVGGNTHGITKIYYESGNLHWETPYMNGSLHGNQIEYYDTNTKVVKKINRFINGSQQ